MEGGATKLTVEIKFAKTNRFIWLRGKKGDCEGHTLLAYFPCSFSHASRKEQLLWRLSDMVIYLLAYNIRENSEIEPATKYLAFQLYHITSSDPFPPLSPHRKSRPMQSWCRPLLEGDVEMADIAQALWEAPFVLLAHDLPEPGTDGGQPLFSYANKAALELFEAEWGELVGQPSSISADADAQVCDCEAWCIMGLALL